MNFSNELINEFKKAKGLKTDAEVAKLLPGMYKSNLSKIRKELEGRHLNEEQAIFIAEQAGLCKDWVLVHLAEESAKSEEAKSIWAHIGKKMIKSVSAATLALVVVFGGLDMNQELSTDFN